MTANTPIGRHQEEIQRNRRAWDSKPELREIYAGFYRAILLWVDPAIPGKFLEIGSGLGALRRFAPEAVCSDLFPNPWLDLVLDGYEIPFRDDSLSHLLLFDVFHHLEAPEAFLREAGRVVRLGGRLLLFEPFVSGLSWVVYGAAHPEPVAWKQQIARDKILPRPRRYYAAQGNATRLFFRHQWPDWPGPEWRVLYAGAWATCRYFLSGGFSRPCLYPRVVAPALAKIDAVLSRWPRAFGGRCLVVLERRGASELGP